MPDFPHLPLPQNVERRNYTGVPSPRKKPNRTIENLLNRERHSGILTSSLQQLEETWAEKVGRIAGTPLEAFIDPAIIPIFLRVDIKTLNVDALRGFGIEIISQEEDGCIIGASVDSFHKLRTKIGRFENGTDVGTALLWEIDNGIGWKRNYILSPELNEKLDGMTEDEVLELDVSISCNIHVSDKPIQKDDEPDLRYARRFAKWETKAILRDQIYTARYEQFENIIAIYGTIKDSIDYNDSFGLRVELSVKGIRDVLFNYPYIFEIVEHDYLEGVFEESPDATDSKVQINAPEMGSPKVCVIDSGLMEGHRLLAPAVDAAASRSYVPGEGVTDLVGGGGHGTRVAGAILYPDGISGNGNVQLPFWIQNAKVLNENNSLDLSLFPPKLMSDIVADFTPTKIFNLSINSRVPCHTTHMSLWAGAIDLLTWRNDILFIISVGNLFKSGSTVKPGIRDFLNRGLQYPGYLLSERFCRIANPSQSCFSLSVGSVTIGQFEDADRISFARMSGNLPGASPFTRVGLGLWGMIKPDVVELGGDLVREKGQNPNIVEHSDTSPHLVKSIYTSMESTGKDRVGTSFAAPRVSNLVANLQQNFPNENCLFYRGLVVQCARLPEHAFFDPNHDYLRLFGYGIPNLERGLQNRENRITLYSTGELKARFADIYSLRVPPEINRPGEDFDVLIEVTLCYKANPRRTRMRTNSYLSQWLDWKTSKLGEPLDVFQERIINSGDEDEDDDENEEPETDQQPQAQEAYAELPWKIRERTNLGSYKHVKRQDNTVQKDWLVMKSYNIPDQIGFAVMGHRGWSKDLDETVPYTLFVSFELMNSQIDIYNPVRIINEIEIPVRIEV